MDRTTHKLTHDATDVRQAVRFSVGVLTAAVGVLVFATLWVSTCGGSSTDTVACGTAERTVLALGAPLILLGGGMWAFVRTYQAWRQGGTGWPWQGAGWFLTISMLVTLAMSLSSISALPVAFV